jgi:hypothetical protein
MAKDKGIQQREDLIDRRQNEREYDKLPVLPEIADEQVHNDTLKNRSLFNSHSSIAIFDCKRPVTNDY